METIETRAQAAGELTLRKLETFAGFAATMQAISLEAACMYRLGVPRVVPRSAGNALIFVGESTAPTLPQCWLLGALAVLLYHAAAILLRPKIWDGVQILHNRRLFVRLLRWAVAVGAVQISALHIDRLAAAVH